MYPHPQHPKPSRRPRLHRIDHPLIGITGFPAFYKPPTPGAHKAAFSFQPSALSHPPSQAERASARSEPTHHPKPALRQRRFGSLRMADVGSRMADWGSPSPIQNPKSPILHPFRPSTFPHPLCPNPNPARASPAPPTPTPTTPVPANPSPIDPQASPHAPPAQIAPLARATQQPKTPPHQTCI